MRPAAVRDRLRSRTGKLVLVVVLLLIAAGVGGVIAATSGGITTHTQFVSGTPEAGRPVRLDTTLYLPDSTPAPAVLLTQGFSGDKTGIDSEARTFAEHGYVALAYSVRGFGQSGGLIHFAAPDYEIKDAEKLVSYLAKMPQVREVDGRAQIAAWGSSYGGGISLLLAAADHRVGAVSADITWNNLEQAFFPNGAGSGPGPFKKLWVGSLFGNGFSQQAALDAITGRPPPPGVPKQSASCGRFAPDVCAAYQSSAAAGAPNAALRRLMARASPASVLGKITAPTQLTQGEQDSLFPLSQADANARGLARHGTPVRVVWRTGGHDTGAGEGTAANDAVSWFDKVFAGRVARRQPFVFTEQSGVVSAETGNASTATLQAGGYPGIVGTPRHTRTVTLAGLSQQISSPGGGTPAVITDIPGLGGISGRFDQALAQIAGSPGQTAAFASPKLADSVPIVGAPTVRLRVTSSTHDATLFAGLRDLAPDDTSTLPSQLVAPIRLAGLQPGVPETVTVQLPSFVRNVQAGHRLVLTVSSTDFSYTLPRDARTYTVALAGGALTLPTASGRTIAAGHPVTWLIVGGAVVVLVVLIVGFVLVRRRLVLRPDPELTDVPVSITALVKEYAGGFRAVDGVTFRVDRGQVVGLLGPNGAGKTTVLRVLVGLITPTSGQVYVFGQPIVPGASVLARLGAFIEGPGFLPHLTGRENLRLYWAATGRPLDQAEFETALDIAGLGKSVDRRVKSYSHGMKQRLGIAQAMLGLPELLVLDEPTNGLDPPQIAEMREVLQRYAETGRTVVVSSHLLAEVEQTCTHVVVMHRGRLVAAGSVAEIAGTGRMQLAVPDPARAAEVLAAAGISATAVPARRALEDVFLDLIGDAGE
jgi:ABC-2 type transport system ATP-binding protein